MFHIDNPFAHKNDETKTAAPEVTQNPEVSPEAAKQVTDLGSQAIQSEVQISAPEVAVENNNYTLPEVSVSSDSAVETSSVNSNEGEVDYLDSASDDELLTLTAGPFGGANEEAQRIADRLSSQGNIPPQVIETTEAPSSTEEDVKL